MKNTFTGANVPRTSDGRLIALGVRPGEVANRVITVGSPSRAEAIALLLDQVEHSDAHGDVYGPSPAIFRLASDRGFLTVTGRYRGVPVSIVSIGMGYPNMDFFVREVRECVEGDLVIVRLGSCGGLSTDYPVGTLVVPSASISIRRNYDYDFLSDIREDSNAYPYEVSKPVAADAELHNFVADKLRNVEPMDTRIMIVDQTVNASTDSFYPSQGGQSCFPDHNGTLLDDLVQMIPGLATFEMETFHLFHLASSWRPRVFVPKVDDSTSNPSNSSVSPSSAPPSPDIALASDKSPSSSGPRIRAAAVQMIFAQRQSQDFISPAQVIALEERTGRAVLDALSSFNIADKNLHSEKGSVWENNRLHLG